MTKIELKDVSYVYGKGTPFETTAIENLSCTIKAGSITGVIGHTGSGKSTFVQMLNGLLRPSKGQVLLDGRDIWENGKRQKDLCFKVGLCFQYPEYQLFEETVARDIAYGPKNMGLSQKDIDYRVEKIMEFVGLDHGLLTASPFDLSGGQQRRVAIAGVMAMTPQVLILDEPAAGLDPTGRSEIFDGIREYRSMTDATVIIVSHSMEDIAEYCDNVLVFNGSHLFAEGTTKEIFKRADELTQIGLDIPQITKFVKLLRQKGVDIPENLYTVEATYKALLPILREEGLLDE